MSGSAKRGGTLTAVAPCLLAPLVLAPLNPGEAPLYTQLHASQIEPLIAQQP